MTPSVFRLSCYVGLMQQVLTIVVALILGAGLVLARDAPTVRTDLTPEDLARVAVVTAPATDFAYPENFESKPGGAGTVTKIVNQDIFSFSAANLTFEQEETFKLGNALFRKIWVSSPSSTEASDGLGPLFNARSCQSCHIKDGRGHPPLEGQASSESMFLRISVPPQNDVQQAALDNRELLELPDPTYGTQIQESAIQGLAAEGRMVVEYITVPVTLSDGTVVELREPTYSVADLGYGDMSPNAMFSPRVAPQMIGLGLVEQIPYEDILANADPDDADGDNISGKPNWVRDPETGEIALGRFGWKAGAPTIRSQSAGAFGGDIGISTPLVNVPHGDCTALEEACTTRATGEQERLGVSEAPDPILDLVTFYSQNLGVPERRDVDDPAVLAGKEQFYAAGCASCHVPKFVTSREAPSPAQQFQLIWPYSDFLLHDMGVGLSDARPEGDADGYEWRTPPLWGIGLTDTVSNHTFFLHDGRARNLTEAVLWHDGEGSASRTAFIEMSAQERSNLIAFLESL
jgi:CxxC motif-containing protein (DUF1111 family)